RGAAAASGPSAALPDERTSRQAYHPRRIAPPPPRVGAAVQPPSARAPLQERAPRCDCRDATQSARGKRKNRGWTAAPTGGGSLRAGLYNPRRIAPCPPPERRHPLDFAAWFAVAVVAATIVALAVTAVAPDLILVGALTVLIVGGALSPADALAGLANPGLATVGVLYVVAAGLVDTGAVHSVTRLL